MAQGADSISDAVDRKCIPTVMKSPISWPFHAEHATASATDTISKMYRGDVDVYADKLAKLAGSWARWGVIQR